MAKTPRRDDEPTRSRRVRAALAPLSRASVAATACILWVGLALPGLQLLPGAGGFGDKSIAISLQSALLGIDNGYAASPEVRAAMRALGLAVISESPVPRLADRRRCVARGRPCGEHPHRRGRHDGRPDTRLRRTAQPAERRDRHTGWSPSAARTSLRSRRAERAGRRRRNAAHRRRRSHPRRRPRAASRSRSPRRPRTPSWAASTSSGLPRARACRSASRSRPAARASARSPARPSASSGLERAPSGRTRQGTRATWRHRRSRSPWTSTTRSRSRRSASSRRLRPAPRSATPPTT